MSKVKKINVRDIDLDLLQNSRIDDVEKAVSYTHLTLPTNREV